MITNTQELANAATPPAVPRRVFVTGANGFIGRALMTRYRDLGCEVCGMDTAADPDWNVVAGDIAQAGDWQRHAGGAEIVINTAAVVSNTAPRDQYWRISVSGVRRALDAAVTARALRFVQISSCAAFGKRFPPGVDETFPAAAATGRNYDDAKAGSEHPALAAHASGEMSCTVIRPGDVYGPRSRPWILIPLEAARKGRLILPAHGKGILSPIYIDDLVDGVVAAAASSAAAGNIFTLTGGAGVTCADFFAHHWRWAGRSGRPRAYSTATVERLARIAGLWQRIKGEPSEAGPESLALLTKPGTFSIEKARRMLGYVPKIDLTEGICRTEAWLRATGLIATAEN